MEFVRFRGRSAPSRLARPFVLLVMLGLVLVQTLAIAPASAAQRSPVAADLERFARRALATGVQRVIIGVRASAAPEGTLPNTTEVEAQRRGIARAQQAVIDRLAGTNARVVARFQFVPYLALEADSAALQALAGNASVMSVHEDRLSTPGLKESIPLIGGSGSGTFGTAQRTGLGQTVAILDTGVMKTHAFLANKVVSEACYSTTSAAESSTAVCTPNSTAAGSGVNCSTSLSGCEHGTHVAGIVAGKAYTGQPNGPFNGVAKDATLIAVQVFSRFTGTNCGGGTCVLSYETDQMSGLERVYALRNTFAISSVNMSLGGGEFTAYCDSDPLKSIIDQLASVNIATVIASGNDGFTNAVGGPGCISSAITVGSTTKQNDVSSFSNSATMVDLLAPGSNILSSVTSSTTAFTFLSGTSMATPHVAGAWAVMKQQSPSATVSQVLSALQTTGLAITDSKAPAITKKRIKLSGAVNSLPVGNNPVPVMSTISPTTIEAGASAFTLTVNGSGFVPNSVVRWKGIDHTTTFVSATQLKATIMKADVAAAGTAQIKVFNPTPGGGLSAAAMFTITAPSSAPVPTITSLSPNTRAAYAGAVTLVVKGTGFRARSVVRWNGVAKTTTYVSATELRATIPASDTATQGTYVVSVATAAPGGGNSNKVNFTVTAPSVTPCNLDEPNNGVGTAKPITLGAVETYAICTVGDKDFIYFNGTAGQVYKVEGFNVAAPLDLVMGLFDAGGVLIYEEDFSSIGGSETMYVSFNANATAYIAFSEWENNAAGSNYTYQYRVTLDSTGSGGASGVSSLDGIGEGTSKAE